MIFFQDERRLQFDIGTAECVRVDLEAVVAFEVFTFFAIFEVLEH